ncbi:MAG: HAD family hydrolase [Lentisphaerales bacterium]|nr:HAD family hydrolase [Lentisphaerales bacterium]
MIKGLIFDLDETLVNRSATMALFLKEQHERFSHHLTICQDTFVKENLISQNNGYTEKTEAYKQVCSKHFQDAALPKKLFDDYINNYGNNAIAMDGTVDLLERLQGKYTLAMITNGKTNCQNKKIDSLGIRHYFKTIKISQTEGIAKPDQRIFKRCLEDISLKPEECVFIGDHPDKDIEAAKSLGMKGIWVQNDVYQEPKDCDAVLTALDHFEQVLQTMAVTA